MQLFKGTGLFHLTSLQLYRLRPGQLQMACYPCCLYIGFMQVSRPVETWRPYGLGVPRQEGAVTLELTAKGL